MSQTSDPHDAVGFLIIAVLGIMVIIAPPNIIHAGKMYHSAGLANLNVAMSGDSV